MASSFFCMRRGAESLGYTSIRLDSYTANPAAIKMYERTGYHVVGEIHYSFRKFPYQFFEKILVHS
ncbi:hypothetical protein [Peribacillus kribbensis]|uniref:hypothetical protein n=1 Tax=Peribacillus kribbensis TaxID=356658 RepID=UPI00047C202A|nr:hypothetical protein [Peribacillus kribbensis]